MRRRLEVRRRLEELVGWAEGEREMGRRGKVKEHEEAGWRARSAGAGAGACEQ